MRNSRDYILELDGLRGLAVWMVLLGHGALRDVNELLPGLPQLTQPSWARLGVDMFFVLSGFLITRILLYEKSQGIALWQFWVRRAARIFPIYYLTVLVIALWRPGESWDHAAVYVSNWTQIFGVYQSPDSVRALGHSWSLAVEEHFYLLWPLAVMAMSRTGVVRLAGALIAGGAAIACIADVAYGEQAYPFIYIATITRAPSILIGALVALYEPALVRHSTRFAQGAAALLAAATIIHLAFVGNSSAAFPLGMYFSHAAASTGILLAVLTLGRSWRPLQGILRWRLLRSTGRIGYGVYLFHYPIFILFGIVGGGERLSTLLATALTLSIAALSFLLIERPIIRRVAGALKSKAPPTEVVMETA